MSLVSSTLILAALYFTLNVSSATKPSQKEISRYSVETSAYTVSHYKDDAIKSLDALLRFKTYAKDNLAIDKDPEFIGFKKHMADLSQTLGLHYSDHGHVILIRLGEGEKKLGLITHGDVQKADESKWKHSPFRLDTSSEPGRLIGRGVEDDKGPIVAAMYAMAAIKDKQVPLKGNVELLIYLAEESNWGPLETFLKTFDPAPLNIALDAEYPVVTAEKAWSHINVTFEDPLKGESIKPVMKPKQILSISGGALRGQIPEDAEALMSGLTQKDIQTIHRKLNNTLVTYSITEEGNKNIRLKVTGKSAHSSKPEIGVNAIAFLARALSSVKWSPSAQSDAIRYLNDLVGTGIHGEQFGALAYKDEFMGAMTLSPTLLKETKSGENKNAVNLFINIRRPKGKLKQQVQDEINQALTEWQSKTKANMIINDIYVGEPLFIEGAKHVDVLLNVFSHFTGTKNPKPVSVGGSTNAKLFPSTVNFGPSMPNSEYTGHSEHEFMTVEDFELSLKMYTAMMIEIVGVNE